jgi:hypothetical protein
VCGGVFRAPPLQGDGFENVCLFIVAGRYL